MAVAVISSGHISGGDLVSGEQISVEDRDCCHCGGGGGPCGGGGEAGGGVRRRSRGRRGIGRCLRDRARGRRRRRGDGLRRRCGGRGGRSLGRRGGRRGGGRWSHHRRLHGRRHLSWRRRRRERLGPGGGRRRGAGGLRCGGCEEHRHGHGHEVEARHGGGEGCARVWVLRWWVCKWEQVLAAGTGWGVYLLLWSLYVAYVLLDSINLGRPT